MISRFAPFDKHELFLIGNALESYRKSQLASVVDYLDDPGKCPIRNIVQDQMDIKRLLLEIEENGK